MCKNDKKCQATLFIHRARMSLKEKRRVKAEMFKRQKATIATSPVVVLFIDM